MGFSAWSMGLSDMTLLLAGPPGEASAASSNLWVSIGSGIHGGKGRGGRFGVWWMEHLFGKGEDSSVPGSTECLLTSSKEQRPWSGLSPSSKT